MWRNAARAPAGEGRDLRQMRGQLVGYVQRDVRLRERRLRAGERSGRAAEPLLPVPIDRGQPIEFLPGRVDAAFTVSGVADGTSLVWSVGTGNGSVTATATADFAEKCSGTPPPSQPVSIFVTCVTTGASTFNAEFGYLNKNGQAVTVPVGSANGFSPAPVDRAQTTLFQPGRVATAFTVAGIPNGTRLVWTLSYAGSTRTATATAGFATKCGTAPPETEKPRSVWSSRASPTARRHMTPSSATRTRIPLRSPSRSGATTASQPSRRTAARPRRSSTASSSPPSRWLTSRTGRTSPGP